jgi:hypothetical protein
MSDAEHEAKVAALIDPVLGAPRRREITAAVAKLDALDDVQYLTRLLACGGLRKTP